MISAIAGFIGYVFVPLLIIASARYFSGGHSVNAAHRTFAVVIFLTALVAAPVINMWMRRLAEQHLGEQLIGQSQYVVLAVALPCLYITLRALYASAQVSPADLRVGLFILTPLLAVVLLTWSDVARAMWERLVGFGRWLKRRVLAPVTNGIASL